MADLPAYERQPYLTRLTTEVISTGKIDAGPYAILADSLLYPEGGGQPADRGRLNGIAVVDVRRTAEGVLHLLEAPSEPGPAELELDWARRYDHMQQHTAQHLLSALAAERFGWETTSFHLGERRSDIELDTAAIEAGALDELEEIALQAVRAARPVKARRIPPGEYARLDIRSRGLPDTHSGEIRLVEIEGLDVTTCGGTHLRSTAEIESIRLGPTEAMRGGIRLYWLAGGRVRRRLAELEDRNRRLRALFESSGEELVEIAATRLDSLKETRGALRRVTGELADARAAALALDARRLIVEHFERADGGFLRRVAQRLGAEAPRKVALLTAGADGGALFLLAAGAESGVDAGAAGRQIAELLGGRGGGSGAVFQGRAPSLDRLGEAVERLGELTTG